jgi:hypothetical protein
MGIMSIKTLAKACRTFALAMAFSGVAATSVQAQQSRPASGAGVTRAQVQKELADLESVGYDATADDDHYPSDLQAAEKRLAEKSASQHVVSADVSAAN